jgi:hypothetical protein
MPRLLDDIIGSLFRDDAGVVLVSCPPGVTSMVDAAAITDADVVIAAEQDAGPREVSVLLARMPRARALTVADEGRSGVLYELRPYRRTIGELSAANVRSTIHQAGRRAELFFEPRPAP